MVFTCELDIRGIGNTRYEVNATSGRWDKCFPCQGNVNIMDINFIIKLPLKYEIPFGTDK